MRRGLKLGVFLTLFGSTSLLFSEVIFVNGDFAGLKSTGKSWTSAFSSLEAALDAAKKKKEPSEIWVKAGIYRPAGTNRTASFVVPDGVKIWGGFSGTESSRSERNPKAWRTILSADIGRAGRVSDNCFHLLKLGEGCELDGLVFSSGNADGEKIKDQFGGAFILRNKKKVLIRNCTFEKNYAKQGGGAVGLTAVSEVVFSNCVFYSNSSLNGGAIFLRGSGRVQLLRSTFSSNLAKKSGGAIGMEKGAQIKIETSWFLYNRTQGQGGAIAAWGTKDPQVDIRCTKVQFNDNVATQTGGALFCRGSVVMLATGCAFNRNVSLHGAGISYSEEGALTQISNSVFRKNKSSKSSEAIVGASKNKGGIPVPSTVENPGEVKPSVSVPKTLRLGNIELYATRGRSIKTDMIFSKSPFSVLMIGDLTDSYFISNYSRFQAFGERYRTQSVRFYYLYSYLREPENNRYIKAFSLRERLKQMKKAKKLFQTTFPWICDGMDNKFAKAVSRKTHNLFIFNNRSEIVFSGNMYDFKEFRLALVRLAGPPQGGVYRRVSSLIPPNGEIKTVHTKRIVLSAEDQFKPLQIVPAGSRKPYFVKLRVEANENLRTTKNGKLFLSFRLDPLYSVKWNNLGATLRYAIEVPKWCAISPSQNQAQRVKAAIDTDPREFLLDVRNWSEKKDLVLTVKYAVLKSNPNRTFNIEQRYIIRKKEDPFGGTVPR